MADSAQGDPHGDDDTRRMRRALELAGRSVGLASPNPAVGCVLVKDERVVGEGFHEYDRRDHAEVVALKQAGEQARDATAYVTLEPCSHIGRTGPCADALIAAGVSRVVVATADPNPLVSGQGLARLRAAGVAVRTGVQEGAARRLNDGFAKYIQTQRPLVVLKSALTLDGRLAPRDRNERAPFWITGEAARAEVQRMRHASDALLTGVNTVLADDPLLSDRSGLPRRRRLLRVVLDTSLRTPLDAKLVAGAQDEDVILFCGERADEAKRRALEGRGVLVQPIPVQAMPGARPELTEVLRQLGEMQITSVMIEAGAEVSAAALTADLVDRAVLFYAPSFLGDGAVSMVGALPAERRLQSASIRTVGRDFAIEGYLHNPWASLSSGAVPVS